MGRGNSTKKAETNYNAAVAAVKEKTPEEKLLGEQAAKGLAWGATGDFRDPRSGGLFLNMGDPALKREHRALNRNAGGQGIYGMGVADPNYLATVKTVQDAENEREDAGQYELDVKEGIARASAAAGDTTGWDISRKMGVLGVESDIWRTEKAKPAWWTHVLSAAAQVGAGVAASPKI